MRDSLTIRFWPEVVETQRHLTVQADPNLLRHEQHRLMRDPDETDAEYAARGELFVVLLDHARHG